MTQDLLQKPQAGQPRAALQAFSGAILGLQGDVLHGWAVDNAHPEQRPAVEILIDGAGVALARADQFEPQAPHGDQFHGFTVQLRASWLADARVITARIANQASVLDGAIALPAIATVQTPAFASQVWHTGGLRVAGWSWDPQSPNRHVRVSVRKGDQILAQATCNTHHQALAYRATSDHGFSLDLPWELADGHVHVLEVVNDLGQPLAGSPIRVCCRPEGASGLLRQLAPGRDAATLALLTEVTKEQDLMLAKSAGWQHYPQWFEAFQRLESLPRPALLGQIGLLLISEGDSAEEETSLASLGADREHIHLFATASADALLPALLQLLAAGCDRILPLTAGDRLAPLALPHLSALLDDGSAWAFADCDRDGPKGERTLPWFKPIWDVDQFVGGDIFTPGVIFSRDITEKALVALSKLDKYEAINCDDFMAGIALVTERGKLKVSHLPVILYHRHYRSPASPDQALMTNQRLNAISWLCNELAPGAIVASTIEYPSLLRVTWPEPETWPRVSLVVPTRDQYSLLKTCVDGLLNLTDYPNLEIIVVDNESRDPQAIAYLEELPKRGVIVLPHPHAFNYSTINNRAVNIATGEFVGLVNNDIEVIEAGWLKEMVTQASRPGVGAVGAKLMWPNRMVQHGGVVVGINGLAAHTGNNLNEWDLGYLGTNQIVRRQSAVTAACLLLKKSIFQTVGGLDELAFPVAFNDVDLCLKIKKRGMHIIWTAFAKLVHAESASRGKDLTPERRARAQREQKIFIERWSTHGQDDPYYHSSLSLDFLSGPYGGLALPPGPLKRRN